MAAPTTPTPAARRARTRALRRGVAVAILAALWTGSGPACGDSAHAGAAAAAPVTEEGLAAPVTEWRWRWPVLPVRITSRFIAPAHAYAPGHRGVDLAADVGADVVSPAAGTVAFSGRVVDRGVVTIDHGEGLVSTLEPVVSALPIGSVVAAGEVVGRVDRGGHAELGTLHLGVREEGAYIDPLRLFGDLPRAVLLPCC